jgi:tetratricopeptide (TPR) repeat protein
MKQTLLAFSACLMFSLPVSAETCSNTRFRDKGLELARAAYPQLVGQITNRSVERTITREELAAQRAKERTCDGQTSLDYLLLLMDVQEADLQEAVAAMGGIMRSGSDQLEKKRMINILIKRFVKANEISPAIDLLRSAKANFPDHAEEFETDLALMLTGRGKFDEAREIADRYLAGALENAPPNQIPYAGWLRLAVSEVSGDKADEAEVISRLRTQYGDETEALIARDLPISTYAKLLQRAYGSFPYGRLMDPPKPRYPQAMQEAGKSGLCDVKFDISEAGVPENVQAECTDDGFIEESVRAVSLVRFQPTVVDGVTYRIYNAVYPIEYNIR